MYEHPRPGDYFFDNVFIRHPQWELRIMPDDFKSYDCDEVLQGTLRDYVLQPGTLFFHELIAGRDAPRDPNDPLSGGPAWWAHEIPVVLSPDDGAWIVGWGCRDDLTEELDQVRTWRKMVVDALVERCGWDPEDIPLASVVLVTHLDRSEVQRPDGYDDIAVFCKEELVDLPHHLGALGTPAASEDPRRGMHLIADMLDIGDFADGNESIGLDVQLPGWMVKETSKDVSSST